MARRSRAQRAAETRYEHKRPGIAVNLRLTLEQADWLAQRQHPDESRPAAIRRLCGMP